MVRCRIRKLEPVLWTAGVVDRLRTIRKESRIRPPLHGRNVGFPETALVPPRGRETVENAVLGLEGGTAAMRTVEKYSQLAGNRKCALDKTFQEPHTLYVDRRWEASFYPVHSISWF